MCDLVARTGRHQQRYEAGCRLVAGGPMKHMFLNIKPSLVSVCKSPPPWVGPVDVDTLRCIPYRYRQSIDCTSGTDEKIVEVLMINSTSGPGLLFPKGGWENDETVEAAAVREAIEEAGVKGELKDLLGHYDFKSKTHQDEFCPEGLCKAAMFAMFVREELESWPEQSIRQRSWLTIPEAVESCRHPWMRDALVHGFLKWHAEKSEEAFD